MNTTPTTADAVPAERPDRVERAAAKRLQGRSRAVWVAVALLVAAAVAVLLAVEAVLAALGQPPALVAPDAIGAALTGGGTTGTIVAATAAVFGLLCLWGALAPGRTHRRALAAGRVPLVVDDAVMAGALSRTAGSAAPIICGFTAITTRAGTASAGMPVASAAVWQPSACARARKSALGSTTKTAPGASFPDFSQPASMARPMLPQPARTSSIDIAGLPRAKLSNRPSTGRTKAPTA